jgi:hypothetical protein
MFFGRRNLPGNPRDGVPVDCPAASLNSNQSKRMPMMNYKILVAASLMSIALTSHASAQCVACAMYPDRDNLNNNAQTPAGKSGLVQPNGAASSPDSVNNARAEIGANNARAEIPNSQRSRRGADGNRTKKQPESPGSPSR